MSLDLSIFTKDEFEELADQAQGFCSCCAIGMFTHCGLRPENCPYIQDHILKPSIEEKEKCLIQEKNLKS
jgi:hypothetical protein